MNGSHRGDVASRKLRSIAWGGRKEKAGEAWNVGKADDRNDKPIYGIPTVWRKHVSAALKTMCKGDINIISTSQSMNLKTHVACQGESENMPSITAENHPHLTICSVEFVEALKWTREREAEIICQNDLQKAPVRHVGESMIRFLSANHRQFLAWKERSIL